MLCRAVVLCPDMQCVAARAEGLAKISGDLYVFACGSLLCVACTALCPNPNICT